MELTRIAVRFGGFIRVLQHISIDLSRFAINIPSFLLPPSYLVRVRCLQVEFRGVVLVSFFAAAEPALFVQSGFSLLHKRFSLGLLSLCQGGHD